jgi:hypothetical protein
VTLELRLEEFDELTEEDDDDDFRPEDEEDFRAEFAKERDVSEEPLLPNAEAKKEFAAALGAPLEPLEETCL